MTTFQQVRVGQRRVLGALAVTLVVLMGVHLAVEQAIVGSWSWETAATDGAIAVLVLLLATLYLRSVARERRREVVEHMLLELVATPRNIRDTAEATTRALEQYGLGDASVIAIAAEDETTLRPMATRGYPREWAEAAPRVALDSLATEPVLAHPKEALPWMDGASGGGKRPWLAQLPILNGGEPIGVVQLVAARPRVLRDRAILELLTRHLSAAFDHAALYEAAYQRERSLEELDHRRREFMAAIAHEIRTPLTAIQAFADLLQAGQADMDETARGLVTSLGQGVQRLSSLINDLIDLGRSGETGYALRSEPVDVGAAVRTAEATLRPAIMLREQSLTLDLPERGPTVVADPRVVEQVILNLLSNANRHSPVRGQIRVVARQVDRQVVRLEVIDDGAGIPEAERQRIFEPYYRVKTGAEVPGSGLGLAVTRRLVEEAGGRIWAEASETGGARFCVDMRTTAL